MFEFTKKILKKILGRKNENIKDLRKRGVKIGENVDILNSTIDIGHGFLISIGNNVTITGATILAHDASTKKPLGFSKVGKVEIGNDVFIGINAIVLMNTKICDKVIIGAGAVVTGEIPSNSVVVGNPFKIISSYDDYIEKNQQKMKTAHIFNTICSKKTKQQKLEMIDKIKIGKTAYDE